jgi:hypothetical protein
MYGPLGVFTAVNIPREDLDPDRGPFGGSAGCVCHDGLWIERWNKMYPGSRWDFALHGSVARPPSSSYIVNVHLHSENFIQFSHALAKRGPFNVSKLGMTVSYELWTVGASWLQLERKRLQKDSARPHDAY